MAEADGAVVAFLALDGDEVDHLYVDPAHHRQGLGAALLRPREGAAATTSSCGSSSAI